MQKFNPRVAERLRTRLSLYLRTCRRQPLRNPGIFLGSLFNMAPRGNPLASVIEQSSNPVGIKAPIHFSAEEREFLQQLNASNHFYIRQPDLKILQDFYHAKQSDATPLGTFYQRMDFPGFLSRLILKKFKSFYSDCRLILPRSELHPLARALEANPSVAQKRELLSCIGDAGDTEFYPDYLSLEEAALSPLIVAQADFMPLSNGMRYSTAFPLLLALGIQKGGIAEEFSSAHPFPVSMSLIAAPDLRNGYSIHYDALMCLDFPHYPEHRRRREAALRQPGFAAVCAGLYGEEYAGCGRSPDACEIIRFNHPLFGEAHLYVNAYKQRLRRNFYQALQLANIGLPQPGIFNLKGLGLGAFAIDSQVAMLEEIFMETLEEVVNDLALPNIRQIHLMNLPSFLRQFNTNDEDLEYIIDHGMRTPYKAFRCKDGRAMPVNACIGASLSAAPAPCLATHICGDSLSFPGNEAHEKRIPQKSSSDESAMFYATGGLVGMVQSLSLPETALREKIRIVTHENTVLPSAGDVPVTVLDAVHGISRRL